MSTLSSLNSRLSNCEAKLKDLEAIQDKITAAMEAYSAVSSEFSGLLTFSQDFVNDFVMPIHDLLSGLGGNAIERIAGDVLVLGSSDEYYVKISQLQSDVEKTHSKLVQKANEVKTEIISLKSTIMSLRQQIREEEARLAEEAERAAEEANEANKQDKPLPERNSIAQQQADKLFG